MSDVPEHLRYLPSHEWIETGTDVAAVGISDHAQSELSDLVYIELPPVGRVVEAGESVAVVESVKAASDIYSPAGGEVVEVNADLAIDPGKVNRSPYGDGWLFKIRLTDRGDLERLLSADEYRKIAG